VTAEKKPLAEANRLSAMLNAVLGTERFPVEVKQLAVEYSHQCFPDAPVDKVQGEALEDFDGMLVANKSRRKWLILYNSAVRSEGRQRFTIAHEFGHYLLHRHQQQRFECGDADIETGEGTGRDIETEADRFASTLLMPLDDVRRQVDGEPISFDMLGHCADRYGVSLTAAALRWIEIAPKRAVLVASRDDHMLWAKSNTAAFKSGAYFATCKHTIELPREALAHSHNISYMVDQQTIRAQCWFPREPAAMSLTEMTVVAGQYDYTLTLLLMPEAEWQGARHDEEDVLLVDTYTNFIRCSQYPVK
jgi:Zn-dependent peptidase ImmA (M78 family)